LEANAMGKTMTFKNPAIYEKAARLAKLTGLSMTQAVKQAVIFQLAAVRKRKQEEAEALANEAANTENGEA
jgi:hypothetical protein